MPDTLSILDPRPISDALKRQLDVAASAIPSGKTGQIGLGLSLQGVEVSASARWKALTTTAYAGRDWNSGWLAGVRATFSF
jgi:hypothetical protein